MQQRQGLIVIQSAGRGLYELSGRIQEWLASSTISSGLLTLYIQHSSASLLIQENADPEVLGDLDRFFDRLVPQGDPLFRHTAEGPDDMPAHVRSALTAVSLSVPVESGELMLGTWQGIYLYEHRTRGQKRKIICHLIGE